MGGEGGTLNGAKSGILTLEVLKFLPQEGCEL